MAYNDDAVLSRLSALNESQESIATAAQWIMFHKRHADRTVALWMQRLKDSSATRRLSLIYLANEVAQQSRIRRKEDFIVAFSPIIAEATALAYKGAPTEIHGKLRRVVDIWKDRSIFEGPIQKAIESRLDELDKAKGTTRVGFGNSPFTSNTATPSEFAPLISGLQKVQKLESPLKSIVESANQEYDKQTDPEASIPSAPVYAARLNGLLRTLSGAENVVNESILARQNLIEGLEKMLQIHKVALETENQTVVQLSAKKAEIEEKKQQVELAIMRALGPTNGNGESKDGKDATSAQELGRPEMEALTPPAMEALTPPGVEALTPPVLEADDSGLAKDVDAQEATDNVAVDTEPLAFAVPGNASNKRRRLDNLVDGIEPFGDDGIDADVAAILEDEGV